MSTKTKDAVLILGAGSSLARGVAEAFARRGQGLFLALRDLEEGRRLASDLALRFHISAQALSFDASQPDSNESVVERAFSLAKSSDQRITGMVLAFGSMGNEARAEWDPAESSAILEQNLSAPVSLLYSMAARLKEARAGFLVVIGSVSGDRGRRKNPVYATAKGGLEIFTQGLRASLHPHGVQVLLVKPGFIDTRMTFGKEGVFALADPDKTGEAIVRAQRRGEEVVYLPRFWGAIMGVIKRIPEPIFKRLNI